MEGTFRNGDEWTGHCYDEEGHRWYQAIDRDGLEYETEEVPKRKPLFVMTQFVGTWTGDEVRRYWSKGDSDESDA